MRLILLILEKDLRRLWPAAAVTWIMLAVLTNADRWRADSAASPMEGWMNALLTFAWACLAALAVLEEPLVGIRNFWTTRPYRWPFLLSAKFAFVALTIHLPLFLSDAFVLSTHGFSPAAHLGDLIGKQLLFLAALTLPSIAVASLVRSFTQFVIVAFMTAAGVAMLNGGLQSYPNLYQAESTVREISICLMLAIPAIGIVLMQYARRRVLTARAIALCAAVAAAFLFARMPSIAGYAVRGLSTSAPTFILHLHGYRNRRVTGDGGDTVPLLIEIDTAGRGSHLHVPLVEAEITTPRGFHIRSVRPSPSRPFEKLDFMAWPYPMSSDQVPNSLLFHLSPPIWQRLGTDHANISGVAAIDFYKTAQAVALPKGHAGDIPDVGRCSAQIVGGRFSEEMLKVLCESPSEIPYVTVTLRSEATGHVWQSWLNSQFRPFTPTSGPSETWISPLHREQVYFHITNTPDSQQGSQWLVPRGELSSLRIELTPEIITGYSLAHFEFKDVDLASLRRRME
jgi:hypothetical protein